MSEPDDTLPRHLAGPSSSGRAHSVPVEAVRRDGGGGPSLRIGAVLKSRFVLEELLGSGGMGTVFKARDLRKEEAEDGHPYVALKMLNEDFMGHQWAWQALQREARKAQQLAHPNIVTVHDFDRDGPHVYMVMELLEGEPLDRLIQRTKDVGIGVQDALRIVRDLCRAVDYAHEQGITHADFKPANAFLTRSGVGKVLDFGIARAVHGTDRVDAGGLALTPAYAGCEVIEGRPPDPRDDIYALACVTYELITGSHPYGRLSAHQAEQLHTRPQAPAGMSPLSWRALRRGLSLRRAGRPASAMALVRWLWPLVRWPAP